MAAIKPGVVRMSLKVLQLTDLHLFADETQTLQGINTEQSFQHVLTSVAQESQQPDLVLLSGDLTQQAEAEAYQRLVKHCKAFSCPVYALPGNHDDVDLINLEFNETKIETEKSIIMAGWHIVTLNSVIAGRTEGHLAESELAFLQKALQSKSTLPTLIVLHHHTQLVNGSMDKVMLRNSLEFNTLIKGYPQVKVVLYGHVHQVYDQTINGIRYLASPSTCYQIEENNNEFKCDIDSKPGYRWLTLNDDGTIATNIIRVE